jgi:hypothetical protein
LRLENVILTLVRLLVLLCELTSLVDKSYKTNMERVRLTCYKGVHALSILTLRACGECD